MAISTNGLQLVRLAGAVFNQQLSASDYSEILAANKTAAELDAWANAAVAAEFRNKTTTDIAKAVLANVGLSSVAGLEAWVAGQLTAGGGVAKAGATMLAMLNDFSNMTADATYGAAATTFNTKSAASQVLSQTAGTAGGTYAAVASVNTALTLTSATQTSNGTAGDDTFSAAAGTWGAGDVVNGGAGTDTLNATITGTGPTQSATSLVSVEVLNLTASPNPATLDLTGVTGLTQVNNVSSANGATLAVSGLGNVVNTSITGGNTSTTVSYATAAVAGTADAATVSLKGTAAGSTFTTSGVETLTINSGTAANTLTSLSASGMTKLVVTGDKDLTIGGTAGNSGTTAPTTTYDLSAATGALTLTTGSGLGTAGAGVTVTGPTAATAGALNLTTGSNNDSVTLGAGANTVSTGAGNDTITSGGGANTITPGTGNDTVNLGAGVDTVRLADVGAANADTLNNFGATDVIAVNIGAAAVTGTNAAAASANATFGVVPTGATSPVLQNVAGTATTNAVVFQTATPATATANTIAQASNVISLNGVFTDGTAAGVITALGATGTTGITTSATGRFLLVTYSVGNTAQVWAYTGDSQTTGNLTDIDAAELSLVATVNGVGLGGLTAANFATYLTPATTTTTVSSTGQTINLSTPLNTVTNTANAAGQYFTAAADTVNVSVGALPTAAASSTAGLTLVDATAGDADVLNATVLAAGWNLGTVLTQIETVNLDMLVADGDGFAMTTVMPGTTSLNVTGSQNLTAVSGFVSGTAFGLGAGYTGTLNINPAATVAAATLNLNGTAGTSAATSPTFTITTSAVTALTINANATTTLNSTGGGVLFNATGATLQGAGNVTLFGAAADFDAGILNASGVGYTGALTLRPADNAAMNFSAGGVMTGIRTIDLRDVAAFNSQITLAAANNSAAYGSGAINVSFAPTASSSLAALPITILGNGTSDALAVSLGANAVNITGAVTALGFETVTISSAAASTVTTAIGNILMDDAAGSQTVTVTGAGNFTLGNVRADTLTTTGVTGTVSATLTNSTGGSVFSGGNGATTITGTALADQITTGLANDVIDGGAGADRIDSGNGTNTITSGTGLDTITVGTGVDTLKYAVSASTDKDVVTNFTIGTDVISFTIGNIAGAGTETLSNVAGTDISAAVAVGGLTATSAPVNTATAGGTTNLIFLSSVLGTSFATAIGTGTITGATDANFTTATEGVLATWYDATNSQAVIGYIINDSTTAANVLSAADTFVEVVRIGVTTANYTAANVVASLSMY